MQGMRKSFDALLALNNVNFQLHRGEIHGLLGGNGAGKTTLMNILYGLYRADAGDIILRGRKVEIQSPKDALRLGIGMVHQHFLQVESFTVTENIVPGSATKNRLTLNLQEAEQRIVALAGRFGLEVDPHARIEDLPMGTRQKVEILKALYRGVQILILDEPTTSLTPQEVDSLFQSVQTMVKEGMSVVFITHKLREVLSVCNRVSVLREGRNVLTLRRDEASEEELVRGMVGSDLDIKKSFLFSQQQAGERPAVSETPVLQVDGLQVVSEAGVTLVRGCSFQVHEKEILGIAGVAGNGQRGLVEGLMGIRPAAQGSVRLAGREVIGIGTQRLLDMGVAYIPEDRLHDGFLPKANVAQNLILGAHRQTPYRQGRFLDWKTIFQVSQQLIAEYHIRASGPGDVGGNLSGGNIQRVMIARAFAHPARLLIAHNPTRGLDIASTEFVYSRLMERKAQGLATLLLSEDLDELLLLCDRIAVIYKGEIVGILGRSQFDRYQIGRMMSGVRPVKSATR